MSDDCDETYRQCVAARAARVKQVIAENPSATQEALATKAGVSVRTIANYQKPHESIHQTKTVNMLDDDDNEDDDEDYEEGEEEEEEDEEDIDDEEEDA